MKTYDLVIVGAGPAGCMAAFKAPPGMKVLMVDRQPLPRNVICGGVLRPQISRWLAPNIIPEQLYVKPRIIDWRVYDWQLERVGFIRNNHYLNINRSLFDEWLLDLAMSRKDLEIWPGTQFVSSARSDDGMKVFLFKDKPVTVVTRYIIGADGAASRVRRMIGAPQIDRWITFQKTVLPEKNDVDEFLAFMGKEIDFYGWVIPKDGHLLIGAGYDKSSKDTKARFEQYVNMLARNCGITGEEIEQTRARSALRIKNPADLVPGKEKVLLVGEAAGLLSAWNGEGISYAVASGALAGMALGKTSPLSFYRKSVARFLVPRFIADTCGRKILMKRPALRIVASVLYPPASFKRYQI